MDKNFRTSLRDNLLSNNFSEFTNDKTIDFY